jgi:acyl homoserine lactone synthase
MIRFIYGRDLWATAPDLAASMFTHRTAQFRDRLGWPVTVAAQGFERDEYDRENPLYVIWERADGTHGASARFLPTTGPTMINDHFSHLIAAPINDPRILECTRFCIGPRKSAQAAAAVMLAGGQIMRHLDVDSFVGVFDAPMMRVYSRIGSAPEVLGSHGTGRQKLSIGLWQYSPMAEARISAGCGILLETVARWWDLSFPETAVNGWAA